MQATARARANIALAKYWGKADDARNLPAVPSVSITLDPLVTETHVRFDAKLDRDAFVLGDAPAREEELARVTALLDRVRRESGVSAARASNGFRISGSGARYCAAMVLRAEDVASAVIF